MAKKVLLTTMSVLKRIDMVNYYFCKKDGKRFFVNGISSLEQGSKYVLSLDSIDKIVVVGTKETIDKEYDQTVYANLLADEVWPQLEAGYERVRTAKENKSAYAFYIYRIAAYLRENGLIGEGKDRAAVDVSTTGITSERKAELEQLYQEICKGSNPFTDSSGEDSWKKIDEKVNQDIEAQYVVGDYAAYKEHAQRRSRENAYLRYYAFCELKDEERMQLMPYDGDAGNRRLELEFVDEQIGTQEPIDNVNGVVNAIVGDGQEDIDLYIDMQGGNRTSGYVRHAMVSILHHQKPSKVHIQMIIGTNFNELQNGAGEIVNETRRYGILDLLSGMNAFVQYGKADMIQQYVQDRGMADSPVGKLVATMGDVDDAISLCNINALADAIKALRTLLRAEVQPEESDSEFVENVFMILRDGIRKDYGALLEPYGTGDDLDYLELIAWCSRKGFLQQALTLIEDKMPELYFKENLLKANFKSNKDRNNFKKHAGQSYEKRIENKLFYSLPFNVIGGPVLDMLWIARGHTLAEKASNSPDWQSELHSFMEKKNHPNLAQLRQYLENQLTDSNIGLSSDKWRAIRQDVERTAELLKETTERDSVATRYCLFRLLETAIEEGRPFHNIATTGMFHRVVRNKLKRNGVDTFYYSILWYLGEKDYEYKSIREASERKMAITLSIPTDALKTPVAMEKLDRMFLMHEALKQERNCSNHASEKGIRLSSETVKKAIDAYVAMMQEIRNIIRGTN